MPILKAVVATTIFSLLLAVANDAKTFFFILIDVALVYISITRKQ